MKCFTTKHFRLNGSGKLAGIKPTRKQKKFSSKITPEINEIIDNDFANLKNKNPNVDEQDLWKTLG